MKSKEVIAYFPSWGIYDLSHQNLSVEMIPWENITIICHSYFVVGVDFKIKSIDEWADYNRPFNHSDSDLVINPLKGHLGEYRYYKNLYPSKKIIISIGGNNIDYTFNQMTLDVNKRKIFVNSCLDFLKKYSFIDGFDLEWETPNIMDIPNLTRLIQELREGYSREGLPSKIITIRIPFNGQEIKPQDVSSYKDEIDLVNLMTFDAYGSWNMVTNHHTPIYNNPLNDDADGNVNNVDSMIKKYLIAGMPLDKICIATPYYSRGWKNVDKDSQKGPNGLFANANGAPLGPWDQGYNAEGKWPWYEIGDLERNVSWRITFDDVAKASYLFNEDLRYFLTYENYQSLNAKCDYILDNNLAGIIINDISGDNLKNKNESMTNIIWNRLIIQQGGEVPTLPPNKPLVSIDKKVTFTGVYKLRYVIEAYNPGNTFEIVENDKTVKFGIINENMAIDQEIEFNVNGKVPGIYSYKMILKNLRGVIESDRVTVQVIPIESDKEIPSEALILSNQNNNEPSYSLTIVIPPSNKAKKMRIYMNNQVIQEEDIIDNSIEETYTANFNDEMTGTYIYFVELENDYGTSTSKSIVVNVINPNKLGQVNLPTIPIITHNNWTTNTSYRVTSTMAWGVNATRLKLYENKILIKTIDLVDNTPNKQIYNWYFNNKSNGIYEYFLEAENIYGFVKTEKIIINVTKGVLGKIPQPIKPNINVDYSINNGQYKLKGIFGESSSANQYILYENSNIVSTGLLTPNLNKETQIEFRSFNKQQNGIYRYKISASNGFLETESANLDVKVVNFMTIPDIPVPPDEPTPEIIKTFTVNLFKPNFYEYNVKTDFKALSNQENKSEFVLIITNTRNFAVENWILEFDFNKEIIHLEGTGFIKNKNHYEIGSIWGAKTLKANGIIALYGMCRGSIGNEKFTNISFNNNEIF